MANYLQQQSIADLLRNSMTVYRKAFVVILVSFSLPILPFAIWQLEAQAAEAKAWYSIAYGCCFLISMFAFGVVTLAISDICLGNRPDMKRAARKIFTWPLATRLLLTGALVNAALALGAFLYWIPALIAFPWLLFASAVIVLEGHGVLGSIKRSVQLAKGYNLRNCVVFLLLSIILVLGLVLPLILLMMVTGNQETFAARAFLAAFMALGVPLLYVAMVLMYYDIRVRKEAYDAAALAEDLRR